MYNATNNNATIILLLVVNTGYLDIRILTIFRHRYKVLFINLVEIYRTHDSYSTCINGRHSKRQKMKIIPKQKKKKRIQAFFVSIMWLHNCLREKVEINVFKKYISNREWSC